MTSYIYKLWNSFALSAWRCHHILFRHLLRKTERPSRVPARLNLGSGTAIADGWMNLDSDAAFLILRSRLLMGMLHRLHMISQVSYERAIRGVYSQIRFCDLRHGLFFDDNCIDYMYMSHCLEHLSPIDSRRLVAECHRALRRGGVLRIVVPDLLTWAKTYVQSAEQAESCNGKGTSKGTADFFDNATPVNLLGDKFLSILTGWGHKRAFDFGGLQHELRAAGFESVTKSGFRQSSFPDLGAIESEFYQRMGSLYVEATK